MDSNSSMRCLVLPWRIWRKVLYLSRPAFTFSAWIRSFRVFLLSSTAPASSVLRNWKRTQTHSEWDPLSRASLGAYSEALPLSCHPCTPHNPHLKTIYCPQLLSPVLCWVLYATSCFGCEIETNFYFICYGPRSGWDLWLEWNEKNDNVPATMFALSSRWHTIFGGN